MSKDPQIRKAQLIGAIMIASMLVEAAIVWTTNYTTPDHWERMGARLRKAFGPRRVRRREPTAPEISAMHAEIERILRHPERESDGST